MYLPVLLPLLAALTTLVTGADILATSASHCDGNRVGCRDIQEGRCCKFSQGWRRVLFVLPANSRGFAYPHSECGGQGTFFRTAVKGNFCKSFDRHINSAKWEVGLNSAKMETETMDLRSEDVDATGPSCSEPNHASFVHDDGTQRAVRVPKGMSTKVEEWLEEGRWDLLERFEDY